MTAFSVCVATVRPGTVGATIAAILGQTFSDWELIVVGQGDAAVLEPAVMAAGGGDPRVRYVHAERRGLSAARNTAMRLARGDILAATDDDCEPRSDWLAVLDACFAEHPGVGTVTGSLLAPPPTKPGPSVCLEVEPEEMVYDPTATPPPAPPGFGWIGGNFAIRRTVAQRIGRFDERLGSGARFLSDEDTDYLCRLEAAGIKMLSTPRSVIDHTYGRRYGFKTAVRYWAGQGAGYGAVLAKLTLAGNPAGAEGMQRLGRQYLTRWIAEPGQAPALATLRPRRLVSDTVRLPAMALAYDLCLCDYVVDDEGLLQPRRRRR